MPGVGVILSPTRWSLLFSRGVRSSATNEERCCRFCVRGARECDETSVLTFCFSHGVKNKRYTRRRQNWKKKSYLNKKKDTNARTARKENAKSLRNNLIARKSSTIPPRVFVCLCATSSSSSVALVAELFAGTFHSRGVHLVLFVCSRLLGETREKNPRYSDTLTVQFFLDRNEFKARGEFASSLLA